VIPEVIDGKNKMEAVPRQPCVDDGILLHTGNFLEVIKSGKMEDLKCPVQDAAHVATVCDMGNIAFRTGRKIFWDGSSNRFTDNDANKLLAARYHNGYVLPKF
jgi:hypothetical protein